MSITFYPDQGSILICDFNTGFNPPEIVKKRPVVVVSPRRNNFQVCIVVPLSKTPPNPIEKHHHLLGLSSLPKSLKSRGSWAKCDMLMTVSLGRLDRIIDGRGPNNARKYIVGKVTPEDFKAIKIGILYAVGLNSLTTNVP